MGASGEGSVTIKSLRTKVTAMWEPLMSYIRYKQSPAGRTEDRNVERCKSIEWNEYLNVKDIITAQLSEEEAIHMTSDEILAFKFLADVYCHPDAHIVNAQLYEFCKTLELIETALISGFYHKHFTLACNVIGSLAKGTLSKNVQALRQSYIKGCLPILYQIRYTIAGPIDIKYAHLRAKVTDGNARKRNWPLCT